MFSRARLVLLVGCLAAPACVGGPTSEWPSKNNDDDDGPGTPVGLDAGKKPASIDAGAVAPIEPERPCTRAEDAGVPMDASATQSSAVSAPDSGCR